MRLCPREIDKLVVHQAGFLAQKRLARGLRLNFTEAVALIASQCLELIRDGLSVSEVMQKGRRLLGSAQVLPGVADMIREVQVEGTFPDGTKLVTVHDPICPGSRDLTLALYGSFLSVPTQTSQTAQIEESKLRTALQSVAKETEEAKTEEAEPPPVTKKHCVSVFGKPGELLCDSQPIALNRGRKCKALTVTSLDDRPIQVGSHYPFIEANKHLRFDRAAAYGYRLNIPAGTAVRFEPGETKSVSLVEIAGCQVIRGGNNLAGGPYDPRKLPQILSTLEEMGFAHQHDPGLAEGRPHPAAVTISRAEYADMYGPTTGDMVRLGDTNLLIKVERDYTVYGDECKFGGGKVQRDGMGQMAGADPKEALDLVVTNALVVDYTGIYKADIGVKDGHIVGIGKAGNPDIMAGVCPKLMCGVNTEVVAGEGCILTAGAMDSHVHFICPQLAAEAIASGITTMVGGGTGPATGSCATTCTPSPNAIAFMLRATDAFPVNIGLTGKGNSSQPQGLFEQIEAGVVGLKLHEDWGSTPAAIDCCLNIADQQDVQVTIHTDTLNESCNVESTIAAFKGRTIHTYHTEGAGGGHAPDIIRVCSEPNVLPSSTNPTRPYTINTIDEHLDMLMVCHHLDKRIPEDVAFAESRIRGETIAAESVLHDMGAISIISSDSQAMGRIGEVITRTWQTASQMKLQRGPLPEDKGTGADNFRVRRYIAKYTINPAVAHGMAHRIGSIEIGKLADLVLWRPAFFGVKPELVIKGGQIAWAQMGDANASIPTPEPVLMRPMFGAFAPGPLSICFVSYACVLSGRASKYGLKKKIEAVKGCRNLSKRNMHLNGATPAVRVDPESYIVTADGERLTCQPDSEVPLAQRYFLF